MSEEPEDVEITFVGDIVNGPSPVDVAERALALVRLKANGVDDSLLIQERALVMGWLLADVSRLGNFIEASCNAIYFAGLFAVSRDRSDPGSPEAKAALRDLLDMIQTGLTGG